MIGPEVYGGYQNVRKMTEDDVQFVNELDAVPSDVFPLWLKLWLLEHLFDDSPPLPNLRGQRFQVLRQLAVIFT